MENYFLVKANYSKLVGNENKNVIETYLFEVISYKEAEDKAIEKLKDNISGEFSISDIKKVSYNEIISISDKKDEVESFWYECKANVIAFDEINGNERKLTIKCLVEGFNISDTIERFSKSLSSSGDNFKIISIIETPILGIFNYDIK